MALEIKPEERVLVAALRSGKKCQQAFDEYCWAKSVVPILEEDLRRTGDPFQCRSVGSIVMAEAMASDAFDDGGEDEQIVLAFREGQRIDRERGVIYRAMTDDERPTPADLIRSMSRDEQMTAVELIGLRAVAHAVAGGEVEFIAPTDTRSAET